MRIRIRLNDADLANNFVHEPWQRWSSWQQQQPSPGTGLLSYRLASLNFGRESGGGSSSGTGHKRAFSLPLRGGDKRDAAALAAAASSARGAKEGANNSAVDTSGIYHLSLQRIYSSSRHPFRNRVHLIRIRIRIQHFMLNPDPDPIRIQGFDETKKL